jgi:CheY-like chemotaxis protein
MSMNHALENSIAITRMLIADDDPAVVQLLAERCARLGFEVDTATNGIQALIKANRNKPDVLIIDVNMPEVDGLSVCARLLDPARRPLNVIVVTGSRDPETVERCDSFGAFYVRKGPAFWSGLDSALVALFPDKASLMEDIESSSVDPAVRKRSLVLVVDADADTETVLSSRLNKCGVDTLYASDALQGYRIACREKPSVIISDTMTPNGDASYLLSRLRTTPATERIPFIVWSSRDIDEQTSQTLKREFNGRPGAIGIFRKSLDTSELFRILQKYCGFENNRV